jgi:rhodanese-related sulfurtransferase
MKTAQQLVADAKANITEIDVNEAEELCPKADIVIDIREPEEYAAGHLKEAISIPRGVLEFKIGDLPNIDADSQIILYCKTSGRAALATESLEKMGYGQVRSIAGGYEAWLEAGKPTVQPNDGIDFG